MKTIPAGEAKNRFGVLMDMAQREAVAISKKGRLAAVMMPLKEYEEYKVLKLERLRREIKIGLDQIERGEVITLDGEEAIDQFFNEIGKEIDS